MNTTSILFLLLGIFIASSYQDSRSYFAPFGTAAGDTTLFRNDDSSSAQVSLIGGMNFFGQERQTIYVDNNGIITLDTTSSDYTPSSLSVLNVATIAPYWADVDTRPANGGFVYYRSTLDSTLAASVSTFVRATNPGSTFVGTRTFVATWYLVGYYNENVNKLDTFQCVLVADDLGQTYAIYNYGDMQWTTGDASGGSNGLGGTPAVVGFAKGDGVTYSQLPTSLTSAIINVGSGTNAYINGVPQIGQYIFSVSSGVVISVCCNTANPPVLSGTPTTLTFTIASINDVPAFTGTVTATSECTSPATSVVNPVIFSVFGCPVTRTWTATDGCLKSTSVTQTFNYPEVFSTPLQITVPPAYSFEGTCSSAVPSPSVSGYATTNRGADGSVTYSDSTWSAVSGGCQMTRYWIASDICNTFQYGSQIITVTSAPVTTAALTTNSLTTSPLTTQPLTTQPLTTQPLTTGALLPPFVTVAQYCSTQPIAEGNVGYYCSLDHTQYYVCMTGAFNSQSAAMPCPQTLYCNCDPGVECSDNGQVSPCQYPQ
jgi:receptor-type tyrosine-protein phosphatase Q/CUB/sushi domain-containing protein